MLYLEDYLELIEHLPAEMVEKLTYLREMDLQAQNAMNNVDARISNFFSENVGLNTPAKEREHDGILKDFEKISEVVDEKVALTGGMVENMKKYMHRLDMDLLAFKMELEADNSGITAEIENKVQKEWEEAEAMAVGQCQSEGGTSKSRWGDKTMDETAALSQKMTTLLNKMQSIDDPVRPESSAAIAAAASQALVATQHMQHGRMTASLKASLEAVSSSGINFGGGDDACSLNPELADATQTALASTRKKQKQKGGPGADDGNLKLEEANAAGFPSPFAEGGVDETQASAADIGSSGGEGLEESGDERYCICNEVAWGTMVACDNPACPYEWYHLACMNMVDPPPEGTWYCPNCRDSMVHPSKKKRKTRN